MKKSLSIPAIGIVGTVLVGVTLAAFFLLGIERTNIHWWALSFLLFAEVVVTLGAIFLRLYGGMFAAAGFTSLLFIYLCVTFVSVSLCGAFGDKTGHFILLELTILALLVSISAIMGAAARHVANADQRTAERREGGEINIPKRGGF